MVSRRFFVGLFEGTPRRQSRSDLVSRFVSVSYVDVRYVDPVRTRDEGTWGSVSIDLLVTVTHVGTGHSRSNGTGGREVVTGIPTEVPWTDRGSVVRPGQTTQSLRTVKI